MAIISLTDAAGRSKTVDFELNGRNFKWHKLKWGETISLLSARGNGDKALRDELMKLLNNMRAGAKDKAITEEFMDNLLVSEVLNLSRFIQDPENFDPNADPILEEETDES